VSFEDWPRNLGDGPHHVGRELERRLLQLDALSPRIAIRDVLLDGMRGEGRDDVIEPLANRQEIDACQRGQVLDDEASRALERAH